MKKALRTGDFAAWLSKLRDSMAVAKITARIDRLCLGNPGDVKPVGQGVSEMRIDYGPGYRVYYAEHHMTVIILLRGGTTGRHQGSQAFVYGMEGAKMTKTLPYDSAEFLKDPEAIQHYMDEAFATGDPSFIAHALGTVARAKSMTEIARKTGLSRESLYRALSADGHPELATIMKVLRALDLRLSTQQAPPAKTPPKEKQRRPAYA